MTISDCSFCGISGFTNNGVCASCEAFVPKETVASDSVEVTNASAAVGQTMAPQPMVEVTNSSAAVGETMAPQPMVEVTTASPAFGQTMSPRPRLERPYDPKPLSNCRRCRAPIPLGEPLCSACDTPESRTSSFKFGVVLLLVAGVVGFFGFDWAFAKASPWGVLRKYGKATNSNGTMVFENFALRGKLRISMTGAAGLEQEKIDSQLAESETKGALMSFRSVFVKPNMAGIEMTGPDGSLVYKQVFDGVSGWRYVNMGKQPAQYQDSEDAFASKKMGLAIDDYESLEFANEEKLKQYKGFVDVLAKKQKFRVSDIEKTSDTKTFIVAKQKHNGKMEETLLAFDESSGFLIGLIKKVDVDGSTTVSTVFFDNYEKTQVKMKGLLSEGKSSVLVPKKITIATAPSADSTAVATMIMVMTVGSIDVDTTIEEDFFKRN